MEVERLEAGIKMEISQTLEELNRLVHSVRETMIRHDERISVLILRLNQEDKEAITRHTVLTSLINEKHSEVSTRLITHSEKIRLLEDQQAKLKWITLTVTAVFTVAFNVIIFLVQTELLHIGK